MLSPLFNIYYAIAIEFFSLSQFQFCGLLSLLRFELAFWNHWNNPFWHVIQFINTEINQVSEWVNEWMNEGVYECAEKWNGTIQKINVFGFILIMFVHFSVQSSKNVNALHWLLMMFAVLV